MSPRPMRSSAPGASRIVRESIWDAIANAIRLGKLALMSPVTTLTLGRCVARTMWMPVARAFWASRAIGSSAVLAAGQRAIQGLHLVDRPLERRLGPLGLGDDRHEQVGQPVVGRELDPLE